MFLLEPSQSAGPASSGSVTSLKKIFLQVEFADETTLFCCHFGRRKDNEISEANSFPVESVVTFDENVNFPIK